MTGDLARRALRLDGRSMGWEDVEAAFAGSVRVEMSASAVARVVRSRRVVESVLRSGRAVYGISTGFGRLSNKKVEAGERLELQRRLVLSHAAGVGPPLSEAETRLMIVLRVNSLLRGNSGCTVELVRRMADLVNRDLYPTIPEQGSVGASGDLAPLAHLGLALIGEGAEGERLGRAGFKAHTLREKEGLSLMNGTSFSLAVLAGATVRMARLAKLADIIGAMTVDAMMGSAGPFDPRIQDVRPIPGQAETAHNVRLLMRGSRILEAHRGCGKIQDNYSVRCMPQVHGAVREVLRWALAMMLVEANASVDNPLVFPEDGVILTGGNFHGQLIAHAADSLAAAATTLGNISERRIDALTNPDFSGLPAFLAKEGGPNSGFMNAQVTAAALCAENRTLCMPAGVMSVPTSAGKEDHVPMAPIAARHLRQIVDHVEYILAIEALLAAQGLDLRAPLKGGRGVDAARRTIRAKIPRLEDDRFLQPDIRAMRELLPALLVKVEAAVGGLK